MNIPQTIDIDALGKLLSLAKSLDEAFKDQPHSKAFERVWIRTTSDGRLLFQVKGGTLWRFFAITLPGREKEYDLGQNFAQLQMLFQTLTTQTDSEIRRAAQGMCMYKDTVIDTTDAVLTLITLQRTLNAMIEYIKQKKLKRCSDEDRKKSIIFTLDAMKIDFREDGQILAKVEPKRSSKKRVRQTSLLKEKNVKQDEQEVEPRLEDAG